MGVQVIPIPTEVVSHSLPFPFLILCFIPIPMGFPWDPRFPGPIGNPIPMHISTIAMFGLQSESQHLVSTNIHGKTAFY